MARKMRSNVYAMPSRNYLDTPTEKLKAYRQDLVNGKIRLVFAVGLPSTGKTKQAIDCGVMSVNKGYYDKLVIIRPVVIPQYGLLPGDKMDKMSPYVSQASAYCAELGGGATLADLITAGKAEIVSSDLLQGNRYSSSLIICDEFQNVHKSETFKILSRLGEASKYIIIGDISKGQANPKIKQGDSMLDYCIKKFAGKDYCGIHKFYENSDILGDKFTKDIIVTLMDDFV